MIETVAELENLYGTPKAPAVRKVADRMVPVYRQWVMASRFCVLTTVGPEGSDGSPRGDDGPVVIEIDEKTLAMPDWFGNNRIDSLRNIVRDPRVSLMFMVPGSTNVVRINGRGKVSADEGMLERFERDGKRPRSVILISIEEIYFQCSRALMRSRLWTSGDESSGLPSPGDMLKAVTSGEVGGADYDAAWPERAKSTMW
ncbi:MAG: pyridoxamine 5'-phosphate oxidase family protein [Boseongicola sp.]|nr:MAG: pyridoxamine 5'-phosphate oxidase family protein [Boseongicola sp.]